jgi:septum formation protein
MRIILASGSPRRKELMSLTGLNFEIIISSADESLPENISPKEAVETLSFKKAEAINEKNAIIIGADTVVVQDGKILGKPSSKEDAKNMLLALSGKTHSVYTGVTIKKNDFVLTFSEKTNVEFFSLSESQIDDYLLLPEYKDKAGAYGIQGKGGLFVKNITGDYNNVVGLPISRLYRELKKLL